MDTVESTFTGLPTLVKSIILRHLPREDKLVSREVCKEWRAIIDDYGFFFKHHAVLNKENLSSLFRSKLPFKKLTVTDLVLISPLSLSKRRTGFTKYVETILFSTSDEVHEENTSAENNMQKILDLCSENIKSLFLEQGALKYIYSVEFLGRLELPKLRELDIKFIGFNENAALMAILTRCTFPRLESLSLDFSKSEYPFKQYYKLYISIHEFIGAHSKTLQYLTLFHPSQESIANPNNTLTRIPVERHNLILAGLKQLSLKTLKVHAVHMGRNAHQTLVLCFDAELLEKQTKLQCLHVTGSPPHFNFELALKNNQESLIELGIGSITYDDIINLDFSWLKTANNLKNLTIGRAVNLINMKYMPKSITSLSFPFGFSKNDLLWVLENMNNLEVLDLNGFILEEYFGLHINGLIIGDDYFAVGLAPETFEQILFKLPKLRLLKLRCPHDKYKIMELIMQKNEADSSFPTFYSHNGKVIVGTSLPTKSESTNSLSIIIETFM